MAKVYSLDAIEYVAKIADGGMRDAITLLDKVISYNQELTTANVLQALGSANYDTMLKLLEEILAKKLDECLIIIEDIYNSGLDLTQFIRQFWLFTLDVYKYALLEDFKYLQLPITLQSQLDELIPKLNDTLLTDLLELNNNLKRETCVKQYVEATLFNWLR